MEDRRIQKNTEDGRMQKKEERRKKKEERRKTKEERRKKLFFGDGCRPSRSLRGLL